MQEKRLLGKTHCACNFISKDSRTQFSRCDSVPDMSGGSSQPYTAAMGVFSVNCLAAAATLPMKTCCCQDDHVIAAIGCEWKHLVGLDGLAKANCCRLRRSSMSSWRCMVAPTPTSRVDVTAQLGQSFSISKKTCSTSKTLRGMRLVEGGCLEST